MAKETTDKVILEIKKILKEDKAVIGSERVIKGLKKGTLQKVYLSSNCKAAATKEIEHLAEISKCPVERIRFPNDELGVLCKKPFPISVLGNIR